MNAPKGANLEYAVLGVVQDDVEDFETVKLLLEASFDSDFSALADHEVGDALVELVRRGLIECFEEHSGQLEKVAHPDTAIGRLRRCWFHATDSGVGTWEERNRSSSSSSEDDWTLDDYVLAGSVVVKAKSEAEAREVLRKWLSNKGIETVEIERVEKMTRFVVRGRSIIGGVKIVCRYQPSQDGSE